MKFTYFFSWEVYFHKGEEHCCSSFVIENGMIVVVIYMYTPIFFKDRFQWCNICCCCIYLMHERCFDGWNMSILSMGSMCIGCSEHLVQQSISIWNKRVCCICLCHFGVVFQWNLYVVPASHFEMLSRCRITAEVSLCSFQACKSTKPAVGSKDEFVGLKMSKVTTIMLMLGLQEVDSAVHNALFVQSYTPVVKNAL